MRCVWLGAGEQHELADVNFPVSPRNRVRNIEIGNGYNHWVERDNSVPYSLQHFLPGSTVRLDGRIIIDKGELKL